MTGVRALTIRQPWASLVAVGAKTIETRSWRAPASAIGQPLLIHAGKHLLPLGGVWFEGTGWGAIDTITDPAYQRPLRVNPRTGRAERVPNRAQSPTLFWPKQGPHARMRKGTEHSHTEVIPLGAVVASCTLTDCVRMGWGVHSKPPFLTIDAHSPPRGLTDEIAFGQYEQGRYAWLLDDVKPTTERCPRCWSQFGGVLPGHVLGSNWEWLPCPTCSVDDRRMRGPSHGPTGCAPVPMRGSQGLWDPGLRWSEEE